MNLIDLIKREPVPEPWVEGDKIPWNEPEFSQRMLAEHLSQQHDLASRRFEVIDAHVKWLHESVLGGKVTRILDLGCGPGLYASRFAQLGHSCVGIDFSPASIAYAQEQAESQGLNCSYTQQDIRQADYGDGFGLAMLVFGEFNVFRPIEAQGILNKAYAALEEDGILVLEPIDFGKVKALGQQPRTWYSSEGGLFSSEPHVVMMEYFWDEIQAVMMERYMIVDGISGEVTLHATSMQAYSEAQFKEMLEKVGFKKIEIHPSLRGKPDESQKHMFAIVARK